MDHTSDCETGPSMTSKQFEEIIAQLDYPRWDHSSSEIKTLAEELIKKERLIYDYIASVTNPTIENVLVPYINYVNEIETIENQITFFNSVSDNKELRDVSHEVEVDLDKHSIEQNLRVDVYNVFKTLSETVDYKSLDTETARFLEKLMLDFKRNGLSLGDDERQKFKELKLELTELSTQFSKNLNEQDEFILFTLEELDGVPQDIVDQFEKKDDLYKMTYKYPDLFPVLRYAHNQKTRERAFNGNQGKCPENAVILKSIIKLRYLSAKLLGYNTYSAYVLEDRLAKTEKNVNEFLNDLRTKLTPLAKKELEILLDFKNKDLISRGLLPQSAFYQWDQSYYNNLMLEQQYQVDHQKIQEYFPLDETIKRMLSFYETLFDIKFVKVSNPKPDEIWHPDVKKFAVFSNIKYGEPQHKFSGFIYFDLHPRQGKYGHAANFGLGPGFTDLKTGKRHAPFTALVCNFTKPTSEKPALLKHSEVETFFHELGHGVHSILAETKYAKFHGTRVPRDFVEAPSQMLEFWIWSKNELKALSNHYKTSEPINDELIDSLIKSKSLNNGLFTLRQLFLGMFDMTVHTIDNEEKLEQLDLNERWNSLRQEISLLSSGDKDVPGYASFAHIAHGYASGYYGYLYSDVFATDMFYTLFKEDPMNVKNGLRYRDIILKRGNSKEMMDNLIELLGREPNSNNFLKELLGNDSKL